MKKPTVYKIAEKCFIRRSVGDELLVLDQFVVGACLIHGQRIMLQTGANPDGWHCVPRLSWGFAYHLRSSTEAIRGEKWRGENSDVPVYCGNPYLPFELQKDEKKIGVDELRL